LSQNSEEGVKDLQKLLSLDNLNVAVRVGDVYALIIEFYANKRQWKQAYSALEEMRETIQDSSIRYYVNPNLLIAIHRELNIDYNISNNPSKQQHNGGEEEEEDDIRDNVQYGTYDD
jgi:hypothetical protein